MSARDPNRYYVYRLIDPLDGGTFYIGKGCGQRAWQHTKDAKRGRICNGKKQLRIRKIIDAGREPVVKLVQERMAEQDALELEKRLIAAEREKLTNVASGENTIKEQLLVQAYIGIRRFGTMIALEEKGVLKWEPGWIDACWSWFRYCIRIVQDYEGHKQEAEEAGKAC